MGLNRALLKGISNKDMRLTLSQLMEDGWEAIKTNGNHIKLTHKSAGYAVYTSSTPSNHRAYKNVQSECRRALRSRPENVLSTNIKQETESAQPAKSKRKKGRWTLEQRLAHLEQMGETFLPEQPDKHHIDPSLLAQSMDVNPPDPELDVDAKNENQPMIKKTEKNNTMTQDTLIASPAPKTVENPQVAPGLEADLPHLPGDLLEIAMRIVQGKLKTVKITSEMVGQTLILDGEAWLSNADMSADIGTAKAATAKDVASETPLIAKVKKPFDASTSKLRQDVLEAMTTFAGEWLTMRQVSELIEDGGMGKRRHRDRVSKALKYLASKDQLLSRVEPHTASQQRKRYSYMKAA